MIISSKGLLLLIVLSLLCCFSIASAQEVKSIPLNQLASYLEQYRGSVVVAEIFGSYCPYCRQEVVVVNRLGEAYRKNGLKAVVISRDNYLSDFQQFLAGGGVYFEPVWLTSRDPNQIAAELEKLGGNYRASIPYTMVINKASQVIYARTGYSGDYNTYAYWVEKALAEQVQRTVEHGPLER